MTDFNRLRLRTAGERKRILQKDFAELCDVSKSAVNQREAGTHVPSDINLAKIILRIAVLRVEVIGRFVGEEDSGRAHDGSRHPVSLLLAP